MKITTSALRRLLREAIDDSKVLPERPWSVEYTFSMEGGNAEDSEGKGSDGFAIVISTEDGPEVRVTVDSYWNPRAGDTSGNSIKVTIDEEQIESGPAYVPTRFDDGRKQRLIISNSPVGNVVVVSHSSDEKSPPIAYAVFPNPFDDESDLDFETESLGAGEINVEMTGHVNV